MVRGFVRVVFRPHPKTAFWSNISVRMETAQRALVDPAITRGGVLPSMLTVRTHGNGSLLEGNVLPFQVLDELGDTLPPGPGLYLPEECLDPFLFNGGHPKNPHRYDRDRWTSRRVSIQRIDASREMEETDSFIPYELIFI